MSVPYKNPISSVQVSTPFSVSRTTVFGTNFSVLNVGGYMEVYKLSDLSLTLTASTYPSLIQLSGNTIPIRFNKGNNTFLSPDFITLNSDNISSGRRRLGMMAYVHETDLTYQFVINDYDTLWNNLTGLTGFSGITYTDYTTVVNNRSSAGQNFINAWTASTIEGVDGHTSLDCNWRIFKSSGSSSGTVTSVLPLSIGFDGIDINSSVVNSATTTPQIVLNVPDAGVGDAGNARGVVNLGNQVFLGQKTFRGSVESDTSTLGTELAGVLATPVADWSLSGTNLNVGGYTHTSGNTTSLNFPTLIASGFSSFLITITISPSVGNIRITFGGVQTFRISDSTTIIHLPSNPSGALQITPSTTFNGTISLSIKGLTQSIPTFRITDSSNSHPLEIRGSSTFGNTFIGYNSGKSNNTGFENTSFGYSSLSSNFNGTQNCSFGNLSLTLNTSGNENSAFGERTLFNNTTGDGNTAIGKNSLSTNVVGSGNTATGAMSLSNINSSYQLPYGGPAYDNVSIGYSSGGFVRQGINNVIIGAYSVGSQSSPIEDINNSVMIGYRTKPLGDIQTNQIVIGNDATGLGSDTTVLGNSATTTTAIYGDLLLGDTTSDGINKLQVTGNIKATQFRLSSLNTPPSTSGSTGTLGEIRIDDSYIYVCVATNTWKRSNLTTW